MRHLPDGVPGLCDPGGKKEISRLKIKECCIIEADFAVGDRIVTKNLIFTTVQQDLMVLEELLASVIHSPVNLITDIGQHLVQAGGKRLRPALYLLCAKQQNGQPERMLPMALAIELIHMATLVHDDVVDHSATRRGIPTANACWGNHISVLTGDYLFAKAFSTVAESDTGAMLKVLTGAICSMAEGEIIQIQSLFQPDQSETDYLERIGKKTAEFIAASCELGGMTAGLNEVDIMALRTYGHALGLAFQITDDILDLTQTSKQLGKPAGNDLCQGVITLPVIYALQTSRERETLRQIIIDKDLSAGKLAQALTLIRATGAIEACYQRVGEYLQQARNILPLSLAPAVRQELIAVANFVGLRKY
ncbi:polyprenyl synthetase [Lucifera butyrica]|uniref:Polyprenyl synthetase n=1 Tax=Lucifera butyrica TaxID=1351585 RepID=A0A498R572_9FIRM|nr:polyprenyl synthetase [Lucifera butyrica]